MKKFLVHLLLVGHIISMSSRADALIFAHWEDNEVRKNRLVIAGIIFLFVAFPIGLLLDKESLNEDFDKKLPFLADTDEGIELKKLLAKNAERRFKKHVVKMSDSQIGIWIKESKVKKILSMGDYSEEETNLAVQVLSHT